MSALEGFPLHRTSWHDERGRHITPHIPEWRRAAGTDRTVRGSEVERNQRQKAQFHAHLEEHRRLGEEVEVIEWSQVDEWSTGEEESMAEARRRREKRKSREG